MTDRLKQRLEDLQREIQSIEGISDFQGLMERRWPSKNFNTNIRGKLASEVGSICGQMLELGMEPDEVLAFVETTAAFIISSLVRE